MVMLRNFHLKVIWGIKNGSYGSVAETSFWNLIFLVLLLLLLFCLF